MNLTRSHMTIFSSTYKSQMIVKVKFVNSVKYQSVTIKMKRMEYGFIYACSSSLSHVSFQHFNKMVVIRVDLLNVRCATFSDFLYYDMLKFLSQENGVALHCCFPYKLFQDYLKSIYYRFFFLTSGQCALIKIESTT